MDKPFSVLMKWQENADKIDKLLYVEGKNKDKMLVHPTGLFSWIKSVTKDPHSKEVRRESLKTCTQFGFSRTMDSMLKVYRLAKKEGDLKTIYVGMTEVNDRPCVTIERVLPEIEIPQRARSLSKLFRGKPKKIMKYPVARLVVSFDVEYVLPTSVSTFNWKGELVGRYIYEDLKLNTGLTEKQFTKKANGL